MLKDNHNTPWLENMALLVNTIRIKTHWSHGPEGYSGPCQTSKMEGLAKTGSS